MLATAFARTPSACCRTCWAAGSVRAKSAAASSEVPSSRLARSPSALPPTISSRGATADAAALAGPDSSTMYAISPAAWWAPPITVPPTVTAAAIPVPRLT